LHKLAFENRHLPAASGYLFNAALPGSALVRITGQKRNENQSTGEIAFDFHPPPNPSRAVVIVGSFAALLVALFAGKGAKWKTESRKPEHRTREQNNISEANSLASSNFES
jgi:hypothetical protein